MPDSLLPIAERAGLLGGISTWVVHESCRQAQAWQRAGLDLRVGFTPPPVLWQTAGLRAGVVSFAIDDFGTGHSSPSRLTRLTASTLKIDRTLARDIPGAHRDASTETEGAVTSARLWPFGPLHSRGGCDRTL